MLIRAFFEFDSMAYRIRQGRHFNVPKPGLDYTETFLYLLDHLGEEVSPQRLLRAALPCLGLIWNPHR